MNPREGKDGDEPKGIAQLSKLWAELLELRQKVAQAEAAQKRPAKRKKEH